MCVCVVGGRGKGGEGIEERGEKEEVERGEGGGRGKGGVEREMRKREEEGKDGGGEGR